MTDVLDEEIGKAVHAPKNDLVSHPWTNDEIDVGFPWNRKVEAKWPVASTEALPDDFL